MRTRRSVCLSLAVAASGLLATACPSTDTTTTPERSGGPASTASAAQLNENIPSSQPGVTDTEIRVAAIGAYTNPVGGDFTQAPKGAQAYFDMVNARGGIYGRELVIAEQLDDQMLQNKQRVEEVISENQVFAVLPMSSFIFTGAAEMADSEIPTFGWLVNEDWTGAPTFFAERGSTACISCGIPHMAYSARAAGATRIGLVAYGVEQGLTCADGVKKTFEKLPVAEVAYVDDTVPFGATDFSPQVQKMKDVGVDMVIACADTNTVITLARELRQQQSDAVMFLPQAYETALLETHPDIFEGSYVHTSLAPVETPQPPPGVADYVEWIDKVPGAKVGEQSLIGWANAALFHEGLVRAGPEFTRASVVDAINQITDWDADGLSTRVDWTRAHTDVPEPFCAAILKVEGGRFVPVFGQPGRPFSCLSNEPGPLPEPAPVQ